MNGLCCFYVGFCRDDNVFIVGLFFIGSITLGFPDFDVFWFARWVGGSVNRTPIRSWYGSFLLCNLEGSLGYLPGQVFSVFDAYVYPCKKLETEFDVFPPFIFVVTVITISSVLVVPLGLFQVD